MAEMNVPPMLAMHIDRLVQALSQQPASTLAAAVIANAGRPVSPNEALKLYRDFQMLLARPEPGSSRYDAWKKEFDGDKVFS
jgi:hypothetical protein